MSPVFIDQRSEQQVLALDTAKILCDRSDLDPEIFGYRADSPVRQVGTEIRVT